MRWGRTVDIKLVLNDESVPDEDKPAQIAEVLERDGRFPKSIVVGLAETSGENYDEHRANMLLERLYDYADAQRIWLGA